MIDNNTKDCRAIVARLTTSSYRWSHKETAGVAIIRDKDVCQLLLNVQRMISNKYEWKLDQGALGMSDPCGTLPLALKPNAVPRINCLLSNFYFCANWSVVPCQMIGLEGPVWGGGYMPRRRRLYANCQLPVELILHELRPNSPGGGYMPTTIRQRLFANWYSTN